MNFQEKRSESAINLLKKQVFICRQCSEKFEGEILVAVKHCPICHNKEFNFTNSSLGGEVKKIYEKFCICGHSEYEHVSWGCKARGCDCGEFCICYEKIKTPYAYGE